MSPVADITVCIGTFGDRSHWGPLAERARASVSRQTLPARDCIWVHADTLRHARNSAAAAVTDGWLCFLDADDELDSRYIEAMWSTVCSRQEPALIQPATLGVHADGREDPHPVLIPSKPLLDGNYMVIGTLVRADQFARLGGFDDWPIYEDWDLWIRCWLDGAQLLNNPNAVYRVHVNAGSRNNGVRSEQIAIYNKIRGRYLGRVGKVTSP